MATKRSDFGAWVKERLDAAGVKQAALSAESGIVYPTLNRLLNSGKEGRPMRPDEETVERIAGALVRLGAIGDAAEAWAAAAPIPEGYRLVRAAAGRLPPGVPERVEELPGDLQEALGIILELRPEVKDFMLRMWLEQARPHLEGQRGLAAAQSEMEAAQADLERRRRQVQADAEALGEGGPGE